MHTIRLTDFEIQTICTLFRRYFLAEDHLWIFGSRVRLDKKGGDIDLYIESQYASIDDLMNAKLDFIVALKMAIGDQKIDIVLKGEQDLPIYQIAKKEGILLV